MTTKLQIQLQNKLRYTIQTYKLYKYIQTVIHLKINEVKEQ
jgi:hypothetical protein